MWCTSEVDGACIETKSERSKQFVQADRLNAIARHRQFFDVGIERDHSKPEGGGSESGCPRDVPERDETQGLTVEPWELVEVGPTFAVAPGAYHLIHQVQTPERRKEQHHRVVSDLFDEGVWNVGNGYVPRGSSGDVHSVGSHASEGYDLAIFEAVDDRLGDAVAPSDEGVAVSNLFDDLTLAGGLELDNLGVDCREVLHLIVVVTSPEGVGNIGGSLNSNFEACH